MDSMNLVTFEMAISVSPNRLEKKSNNLIRLVLSDWPCESTDMEVAPLPGVVLRVEVVKFPSAGFAIRRCTTVLKAEKDLTHVALERKLFLPSEFTMGFCCYHNVATGFPLLKEDERWVLFGPDQNYYVPYKDTYRFGEADRQESNPTLAAVEGTWNELAPHGKFDLYFAPTLGQVIGVITRGELTPFLHVTGKNSPQWTQTDGRSDVTSGDSMMQITDILVYQPGDTRFWWQEGLEFANCTGLSTITFRIATSRLTYKSGEEAVLYLLGRKDIPVLGNIVRFGKDAESDMQVTGFEVVPGRSVFRQNLPTKDWETGIYRINIDNDLGHLSRNTVFIVRPKQTGNRILYVAATNQWRSYAFNGHYHGGIPKGYPWSYCYSAQLMEGISDIMDDVPRHYRYPLQPSYYNNMPSGFALTSLGIIRTLEGFAVTNGSEWGMDYCAEEDIHFGRVDLSNYKVIFLDNHAEYSTWDEMAAFQRYLESGTGYFIVLGGDAFGRLVHYILDGEDILFQNLHNSNCRHYPDGAQFTDEQRFERFGIAVSGGLLTRPKYPLTVVDNDHPITQRWGVGDVISVSSWECDDVSPRDEWRLIVRFGTWERENRYTPGVAIHRRKKLISFGPMGIAETLAGYYGYYEGVKTLLEEIVRFCLEV